MYSIQTCILQKLEISRIKIYTYKTRDNYKRNNEIKMIAHSLRVEDVRGRVSIRFRFLFIRIN